MSDDNDNTEDLEKLEMAALETGDEPARRWEATTDRFRRHPIGVAVGTGIAALLVGGVLGSTVFGGTTPEVGTAATSSRYAAEGPACLDGPPPPPPDGQGGPGGVDGPDRRGGPGGPSHHGGPGEHHGPGASGPGRPGPKEAIGPENSGDQVAPGADQPVPKTPLLPAEQPAR